MTTYALKPADSELTVELTLASLDALFDAPAANPFSSIENEVLGRSGIDLLRRQHKQHWPRHDTIRRLVILLPADAYQSASANADLAEQTPAAIGRFCQAQIEASRTGRRLERVAVRHQLRIVVLVVLFALLMVFLTSSGVLGDTRPVLQNIVTLLAVFAACLAIWDTLGSILFSRLDYLYDERAYRWIGGLAVEVAPLDPVRISTGGAQESA